MESSLNISVIAGIVLSILFEYVPGIAGWYEGLDKRGKQGVMALALLLVSLAAYGFSCLGWFNTGLTCDEKGVLELVKLFIAALVANQSTYLITRKD